MPTTWMLDVLADLEDCARHRNLRGFAAAIRAAHHAGEQELAARKTHEGLSEKDAGGVRSSAGRIQLA